MIIVKCVAEKDAQGDEDGKFLSVIMDECGKRGQLSRSHHSFLG